MARSAKEDKITRHLEEADQVPAVVEADLQEVIVTAVVVQDRTVNKITEETSEDPLISKYFKKLTSSLRKR